MNNKANSRSNDKRTVAASQLRMHPGQSLADKAKELGLPLSTLKLWTAEWKGSGFDPDYAIERAGHDYWLTNVWKDRDWVALLKQQIAKRQHRHVGDLLFALGLTNGNAQVWSQKHAEFEKVLWAEPHPNKHWRDFIRWVRHGTNEDYRARKAKYLDEGMCETLAMQQAADDAGNDLKHKTRQRRRVERDILLGVGGHEELLRRYRKGARLTDAHSKRIAKKLFKVGRWKAMERGLREVGFDEAYIKTEMARLKKAFGQSDENGQAQWKQTREAVLRRRAVADQWAGGGR